MVNDEEMIGDLGPGRFVIQNVILSLLLTMLTHQALLVLALTLAATATARHDPWTTRYGSTPDFSFSGITTFAHLPHVKCLDSPDTPVDIAILGIPFDSAVSFRPGKLDAGGR